MKGKRTEQGKKERERVERERESRERERERRERETQKKQKMMILTFFAGGLKTERALELSLQCTRTDKATNTSK